MVTIDRELVGGENLKFPPPDLAGVCTLPLKGEVGLGAPGVFFFGPKKNKSWFDPVELSGTPGDVKNLHKRVGLVRPYMRWLAQLRLVTEISHQTHRPRPILSQILACQ